MRMSVSRPVACEAARAAVARPAACVLAVVAPVAVGERAMRNVECAAVAYRDPITLASSSVVVDEHSVRA
jgi:hypothetical protein